MMLLIVAVTGCGVTAVDRERPTTEPTPQSSAEVRPSTARLNSPPPRPAHADPTPGVLAPPSPEPEVEPEVDCSAVKCVALTFDDGPGEHTEKLLDILERHQAKATFFVVGPNAESNPGTMKRMVRAGHELGNHTWHHPVLPQLTDAQVRYEFDSTDEVIRKITGNRTKMNRPPYGASNPRVNRLMPSASIMWSIDTLDWRHRDAATSIAVVKEQLSPGAIVLFHDIHAPSVAAIEPLLKHFAAKGYHPVTVSQILASSKLKPGATFERGDAPAPRKAKQAKKRARAKG